MRFFKNFAAFARTLPFFLEEAHHDDLEAS
jgi:hypothetical protein